MPAENAMLKSNTETYTGTLLQSLTVLRVGFILLLLNNFIRVLRTESVPLSFVHILS